MAITVLAWMLAIPLLGLATGLRTLTSTAVLCWFAYFGYLSVDDTWASWTAKLSTAIIFTVLALAECVADKLPRCPNRTSPGPLLARLVFGGLVGALAATGLEGSALEGIILGSLGALLGAFVGFHIRRHLVERTGWPDWVVAVGEDALTITCAVVATGIVTG